MYKRVFICTLLAFVFLVPAVLAVDDFTSEYFKGKVAVQRLVDAEVCIAVWHDGSDTEDGTAVTSAHFSSYVDVACTLKVNGELDTRVSTDGIIAVSGEATFGALADAINAVKGWHCQLVDVLRADATTYINTVTEKNVYKTHTTMGRDTDTELFFGVGLVRYGYGKEDLTGWQVFLDAFVIDAVFNDGTNYVEVYDCDDAARTETAILRTEAAATTVEFWFPTYGPTGYPILAVPPGHRIVVKSTYSAASNPDALSLIGALGSIVKVH
jgi:hypothetical protein